MPQINRIRVNNVKYNFGTQYYDDFMMRFNCNNTIYDLANGGGKSLLMLLLLQNVIPNCTLDDKQPIEKLFRAGGGNTVIHSLVEWKLDACYRKDNFKYMTTGFCARKAKGAEDDTGSEQATAFAENSSVEYFNYCIFYREFGDNDIKNLPLASNGERITYNGLKAYLRELEKKDFNVSVKIFDRKGDYQSFISQYGIFESQWEIIRGINKTEGHVRTYFESNYRTSRKVVEDLLIEEIIQKAFNNKVGTDSDDGKMAQTLLDIKDKLLELSKKHAQISAYDSQINAIDDFAEYVGTFIDLYDKKEQLEKQLFDLLMAAKRKAAVAKNAGKKLENVLEDMNNRLVLEHKNIQTVQIISEQNSLEAVTQLIRAGELGLASKDKELETLRSRLLLLEAANDYNDYRQYSKSCDEIKQTIDNHMRNHSDIAGELRKIACVMYERKQDKETSLKVQNDELKSRTDSLRTALAKIEETLKQAGETLAVKKGMEALTRQNIDDEEKQLAALMEKAEILLAENVSDKIADLQEELASNKFRAEKESKLYKEAQERFATLKTEKSNLLLHNEIIVKELENAKLVTGKKQENANRIAKLNTIYNAAGIAELEQEIFKLFKKMDKEYSSLKEQENELEQFIENAKNGRYILRHQLKDRLYDYLTTQYGDDVSDGQEWLMSLSEAQREDVLKKAPFAGYGFVVKNDFERIKNDTRLADFARNPFVIPIISENILKDTKPQINKECVAFALKDITFLGDSSKLAAEVSIAGEELDNVRSAITKLELRKDVVWEDYLFVMQQAESAFVYDIINEEAMQEEHRANTERLAELEEQIRSLAKDIQDKKALLEERTDKIAKQQYKLELLNMTKNANQRLEEKYQTLKTIRQQSKEALILLNDAETQANGIKEQLWETENVYATVKAQLEKLNSDWVLNYKKYYEMSDAESATDFGNVNNNASDSIYSVLRGELEDCDDEQLESRFFGLKEVLDKDTIDIADKEKLMEHYRISMEKCKNAIEYRGVGFEDIKAKFEAGAVGVSEPQKLYELKTQIDEIIMRTRRQREELDAQNALMNRLEGSIAHGINQITEKYGEFEAFECDSPESYIKQHREMIKQLSQDIKDMQAKCRKSEKELNNILVIEKDLERIITNAGMTVPNVPVGELAQVSHAEDIESIESIYGIESTMHNETLETVDLSVYEEISKAYNKHMKLIFRKNDEFNIHKQSLIDRLSMLEAAELAREARVSVNLPENVSLTEALVERLKETNTFIQLEKERVAKGIEDMERIKDNFENRCIQTCSNIKTELDRLHKLSKITMDDEVISIIGVHIPYIKEELYKERMSSYIDETIMIAESFKNTDERLKYIRNRLSWKKLFSVIVTDMNSVRIELYKRERIKDQSRYLKYEEAVGSTGQSQGIYIQFLIAIINYISSINASSKETAFIGKTIFIDNPFGAAKDIYIWEPIFKLLKTNHVQLIVPARGATPAITGRFDVNYILGQKLSQGRQQTVVVDYYSKTNQNVMEYTRMDYEQTTLDL